jgi:hypothetical protein
MSEEEQNELERNDEIAPRDYTNALGGDGGFALRLAYSLMLVVCLSLAALSLLGGVTTLGLGHASMIIVMELFVVCQIAGLFFAYRFARRSNRASLVIAGSVLVVVLWVMSVGLCSVSTQSLGRL